MLVKKLQKEIEALPSEVLQEVKIFIKTLKIKKVSKEPKKKKTYNVFDEIEMAAVDTGVRDWARNHDHYLYGTEKR